MPLGWKLHPTALNPLFGEAGSSLYCGEIGTGASNSPEVAGNIVREVLKQHKKTTPKSVLWDPGVQSCTKTTAGPAPTPQLGLSCLQAVCEDPNACASPTDAVFSDKLHISRDSLLLYADAVWGALRGEACLGTELSAGHSCPPCRPGYLPAPPFSHRLN